MMYALKLCTNGDINVIEVPGNKDWRWYSRQIGCDLVEVVRPMGLESPRVLIVDEEGLLKERPVINFLASWLYETHLHGNPICGDCLVMEEYETVDGIELGGMPKADALKLADGMKARIWEAVNEIKKAMGISLVRV